MIIECIKCNKKFEVNLFGRRSRKKRSHEIKIKKINVFNNILSAPLLK